VTDLAALVSDNLGIWTSAIHRKSGAGRGGGKRISLYGIERLRALILELGVRGKLVPQDLIDEPTSGLLKRIRKNKAERIRTGELRKPRERDDVPDLEVPFSIPATWQWVRLDEVGAIVGGGTPPASCANAFVDGGEGVPWLTPADLGGYKQRYIAHGERDLSQAGLQASSATLMPTGSVLFTSRAPIGYVVIAANPIATNQGFKSIVPYVEGCSVFIATALRSFAKTINDNAPGTTFKEVSGKIVAGVPFPLPPLAEQQRIVAKVDELMALCDALERESADAMAAHQALVETLLATLTGSTNAADLATNWARLETHFDTLFTTDASVETLKQTILDLAVRGKLVEQRGNDRSGEDLFDKIMSEPWKKPRKRANLVPDDKAILDAYAIPRGWAWATVDALVQPNQTVTYGILKPVWVSDGIPTVRVTEMKTGFIDILNLPTCSPERASKFSKTKLSSGDLLISKDGTIGKTAFVPPELEGGNITQHMLRFPISKLVNRFFVRLVIDAPFYQNWMAGETKGVALRGVNVGDFRRMPIPLPSVEEQHRIVAKVDALMALCDQLKTRLADAAQAQRHLADAIVEQAAVW